MSNDNSIPSLVELLVKTVCSEVSGQFDVCVQLRADSEDLDAPDGTTFNVSFKRAYLKLDRNGVELVDKTRFGEPTRQNVIAVKHETSSERVVETQAGAHVDASVNASTSTMQAGGDLKAGASANHNVKDKTTVSTSASDNIGLHPVSLTPA